MCNISSEEYLRCWCCSAKYHASICKAWLSCTMKLQDQGREEPSFAAAEKPLIIPVSITNIWGIIQSVPAALSCQRSSVQHRSGMIKKRKYGLARANLVNSSQVEDICPKDVRPATDKAQAIYPSSWDEGVRLSMDGSPGNEPWRQGQAVCSRRSLRARLIWGWNL